MSHLYEITGGSQVGWLGVSWPLAKLSASSASLSLRVHFVGDFSFRPDEVISITRYSWVPFFAWGVRIEHCNPGYPKRLIFWAFQNPRRTLEGIQQVGFKPTGAFSPTATLNRGSAMRWQVLLIALVLWNGLFILDVRQSTHQPPMPGLFSIIAMVTAFAATIATLRVPSFQRFVLKPGRKVDEVRHMLKLFAVCTGLGTLMLLTFLFATATRNSTGG